MAEDKSEGKLVLNKDRDNLTDRRQDRLADSALAADLADYLTKLEIA